MKESQLEEALRALRSETGGEAHSPERPLEQQAARTLDRVLATTRRARTMRMRAAKLVLPIAAVLVASSAWALGSGRLAHVWHAVVLGAPAPNEAPRVSSFARAVAGVRGGFGAESARSVDPTLSANGQAPIDAARAPREAKAPPARMAAADVASAVPANVGAARAAPVSAGARPEKATAAEAPAKTDEGALPKQPDVDALAIDRADFEVAYRVHASGGADAAARAWDVYLAAHPTGRFVPEARFARGVALMRGGHTAAAREALRPFAEAPAGGYRREDAIHWLEASSP